MRQKSNSILQGVNFISHKPSNVYPISFPQLNRSIALFTAGS